MVVLFILLLFKSLIRVLQNVVHKNRLGHVSVGEGAREDIGFELLCEETLHILINKFLEEFIEKEERLPDVDTNFD